MGKIISDQYEQGTQARLLYHIVDGFYEGLVVTYHSSVKRTSGEIWHIFINNNGERCHLLEKEFELINN